jgi:ribonuclease HIII
MAIAGPRAAEARARLGALIDACRSEGLTVGEPRAVDYGEQVTVSDGRATATLTVYGGKAGVRTVPGGRKDTPLYDCLVRLAEGQQPETPIQKKPTAAFPPAPWIGSDESGKGDYFGPLVAAAVYVAGGEDEAALRRAGVRDSKLLDDATAQRVAAEVRRVCGGRFAEEVLPPAEYNAEYARFRAEKQNLNHLLARGHARVLTAVLTHEDVPLQPRPTAIADQFADERYVRERLQQELERLGRPMPVLIQTPRAEANVAVAAASILARDRFLEWLEETSRRLGVELPKGGSKPSIIAAARRIVESRGDAALGGVAKLHFATTKQVYASLGR